MKVEEKGHGKMNDARSGEKSAGVQAAAMSENDSPAL